MNQKFPKGEIKSIQGRSFTMKGDDIDTDRIIPARFLKCVSFSALGEQVFADDRKELKGNHPFDLDQNKGANILVVNDNFGCGSSREHAPQALMRWGIRLIIGESFAEIFFGNCLALGIPCLTASKEEIVNLQNLVEKNNNQIWDFNLKNLSISNQKETVKLFLDEGPYNMLFSGKWDATSQLLDEEEKTKNDGFTYIWDQHKYDPITGSAVNYIHFKFKDGSKIKKAFTYEWRVWTLPEILEMLTEAGFKPTVYWEQADEDGEGNGEFLPQTEGEADAGWIAYIVSQK